MRDPNDVVGIARLLKQLRVDLRTGLPIEERDMPRSFTTISFNLGATAAQLYTLIGAGGAATINASAQGICYGLVLSNNCVATGGTLTIWEGTASAKKFEVYMVAADVQDFPRRKQAAPLFKWQPGKTLQARHALGGKNDCVAVNMCYWAEEP